MEQTHSQALMETAARHRQELQMEIERLRNAQIQAERTLDARERAHRQRVKGLEEQVSPFPGLVRLMGSGRCALYKTTAFLFSWL